MKAISSFNTIEILEEDGKETQITYPTFSVQEHWNRGDLIIIGLTNSATGHITVRADDLIKAIQNAQNAH